jgi:aminoglycoside phosphotransferase (APT) family kinase protein
MIDSATQPRSGEELDTGRLRSFLQRSIPGLEGDLEVLQFLSGFSNLTYLVTAGDLEFVLRRPPFGTKPSSGHDMKREHTVLSALHGTYPYGPRPVVLCEDLSVLGAPFFVMERLRGIIVRNELPAELDLNSDEIGTLFSRVIAAQAELHAVDPIEVGLEHFGRPEGYAHRQVQGWSKRYAAARTPNVPDGEQVMTWLAANTPTTVARASIIHNDFRLDNVVLDPDDPMRILGVLDWEMATLGDPLMDLGASLAYWVEAEDPPEMSALRMMPTHLEGAPTRAQVVQQYAGVSGMEIDGFDFYYCYGLFRLAGIIQQIYFRSYHSQTEDDRFKNLHFAVHGLIGAATAVISGSLRV